MLIQGAVHHVTLKIPADMDIKDLKKGDQVRATPYPGTGVGRTGGRLPRPVVPKQAGIRRPRHNSLSFCGRGYGEGFSSSLPAKNHVSGVNGMMKNLSV